MLPDQVVEAAGLSFVFDLQPQLGAPDRRLDLGAASDDAVILQQPVHIARAIAGNFVRIEIVKGFTEILSRFRRMVIQLSPAWKPSSTSFS